MNDGKSVSGEKRSGQACALRGRGHFVNMRCSVCIAINHPGRMVAESISLGCRSQIDQSGGAFVLRFDNVIWN